MIIDDWNGVQGKTKQRLLEKDKKLTPLVTLFIACISTNPRLVHMYIRTTEYDFFIEWKRSAII